MADFILPRIRSLSAAKPSHFYQGLAEWQLYQGRPAAVAVYQVLSRPAYGRFVNHGRFINEKRANCQICRFGLRMVDFTLSRASSLQRPGELAKPVAALSDRPAAMAALSKPASSKASSKLCGASSTFSFKAPRKASYSSFACAAP